MKVALVRKQLRCRDVLKGDLVMRGIGDHSVAVGIVMSCREHCIYGCEHRLAELDGVGRGRKACDTGLTKIWREHKRIVRAERCDAGRARAFDLIYGHLRLTQG